MNIIIINMRILAIVFFVAMSRTEATLDCSPLDASHLCFFVDLSSFTLKKQGRKLTRCSHHAEDVMTDAQEFCTSSTESDNLSKSKRPQVKGHRIIRLLPESSGSDGCHQRRRSEISAILVPWHGLEGEKRRGRYIFVP